MEKKKTGQIKGMINMRMLILLRQYKWSYPMFVPNFKILGAVVPEKSLTQIFLCTGVRDGKMKEISTQDTSTLCRCIQNLKTLAL